MLKAEVAAEWLKSFEVQDGEERRRAAVAALPEPLRAIGFAIMNRDAAGGLLHNENRTTQAMEPLEKASPAERMELFTALFPTMARDVDLTWQHFPALPYHPYHNRRAFRAPHAPELLRTRRGLWLYHALNITAKYEQNVAWYAAWAPYLGYYADGLGLLFAAVIDAGGAEGEEMFETLLASARGEHEIGVMGKHVTRGLLVASRPEGWEFIEKLLLAAQRQEGLRQTVLETVDEAHPEAFRRMLRLLLDHELLRFSSVTRAVDVWTGFQFDALKPAAVRAVIVQLHTFLTDADARTDALSRDDPQAIYLALWAIAYENAEAAVEAAVPLLAVERVEIRFVAAALLRELRCRAGGIALLSALEDEDLRVVEQA